jgi:hypothetical protein
VDGWDAGASGEDSFYQGPVGNAAGRYPYPRVSGLVVDMNLVYWDWNMAPYFARKPSFRNKSAPTICILRCVCLCPLMLGCFSGAQGAPALFVYLTGYQSHLGLAKLARSAIRGSVHCGCSSHTTASPATRRGH